MWEGRQGNAREQVQMLLWNYIETATPLSQHAFSLSVAFSFVKIQVTKKINREINLTPEKVVKYKAGP